jgi:hypothetical protein
MAALGATLPLALASGKDRSPPIADTRPSRRERLFMPHCGHSLLSAATAHGAPLRHSFDACFGRI